MDIHDARSIGFDVETIDEIGGQIVHETGQNQQINGMGVDLLQQETLCDGTGGKKRFDSPGVRFRIEQMLLQPHLIEVKIRRHPGRFRGLVVLPDNGTVFHHKCGNMVPVRPLEAAGAGLVRAHKHHSTVNTPVLTGIDNGLQIGSPPGNQCTDTQLLPHPVLPAQWLTSTPTRPVSGFGHHRPDITGCASMSFAQ
jgi:hypothetical protein